MSGQIFIKIPDHSCRTILSVKTWKKLWCILRPSPILEDGIFIILHLSAHGNSSSTQISIPKTSIVTRTESKTKKYCFAIYSTLDSRRPLIYMAGNSEKESQQWMLKIRCMLAGKHAPEKRKHNGQFAVSLIDNNFSTACGLRGLYGQLKTTSNGFEITNDDIERYNVRFSWNLIESVNFKQDVNPLNTNVNCVIITNRNFFYGSGQIVLFCEQIKTLVKSLRSHKISSASDIKSVKLNRRLSRSEGTLFSMTDKDEYDFLSNDRDSGLSSCGFSSENGSKWDFSSDESRIRLSMDENGFVLKGKMASSLISAGLMLSTPKFQNSQENNITHGNEDCLTPLLNLSSSSNGMPGKRYSGISIASGVYEEIPDDLVVKSIKKSASISSNTYEVLNDCIYGTTRRRYSKKGIPPPLPPRYKSLKFDSDSGVDDESLYTALSQDQETKWSNNIQSPNSSTPLLIAKKSCGKFQCAIGAFRKRIKSESQYPTKCGKKSQDYDATSMHSDSVIVSRKKHFGNNATPAKSTQILKKSKKNNTPNKFKNMKDAAKSCEALDAENDFSSLRRRYSQSEENLIGNQLDMLKISNTNDNDNDDWSEDEISKDLSLLCAEEKIQNSYPKDVLDLLLTGKLNLVEMKLKQKAAEEVYIPMCDKTCCVQEKVSEKKSTGKEEGNYMIMKSA